MKYALMTFLLLSGTALAASQEFNKTLNDDLKTEIKKDDFKYKKKSHRAPASVETLPVRPVVVEPKIHKTKQIGPQKW